MMWVSLLLFVLFAGIAYVYAIQGLFSSLITCVLTIAAAGVAFSGFENLAAMKFLMGWRPSFAQPIAFMGLFLVTLIILRAAADGLIRRACLVPMIVDRVGGGVFGIIAGLVTAGMLGIAIQMIPLGGSILGFARFEPPPPQRSKDDYDEPKERRAPDEQDDIFLNPDRFVVRLASMLGDGVFSDRQNWDKRHPDFITQLGWAQTSPRGIKHLAPPDSCTVVGEVPVDAVYIKTQDTQNREEFLYEPKPASSGSKWYGVKLHFDKKAADSDGTHRFILRHVLLVGKDHPDNSRLNQYYPKALSNNDPRNPDYLIVGSVDQLYGTGPENDAVFAFEVPTSFVPDFIEYKGLSRTGEAVFKKTGKSSSGESRSAASPVAAMPTPLVSAPPPAEPAPPGFQGRVTGARGKDTGTRWGDTLPYSLVKYSVSDPEIDRGKKALIQGTLFAYGDEQGAGGSDAPLERFVVPSEKRLLQFSTANLRAGSVLGQAKAFAVKVLEEYQIHSASGKVYNMVGKYAIANVGDREVFELQYFPEYAEGGARTHKAFQKIRDVNLQGSDYTLVFLYLIEPGDKLVKFSTGGNQSLAQDLTSMNLVAPP